MSLQDHPEEMNAVFRASDALDAARRAREQLPEGDPGQAAALDEVRRCSDALDAAVATLGAAKVAKAAKEKAKKT